MRIMKTASNKFIIKINRTEWINIGKLAGWWIREYSNCGGRMWALTPGTKQIDPNVVKEVGDRHRGEVEHKDMKEDKKSHTICNKCGREKYPDMLDLFNDPINDVIEPNP